MIQHVNSFDKNNASSIFTIPNRVVGHM